MRSCTDNPSDFHEEKSKMLLKIFRISNNNFHDIFAIVFIGQLSGALESENINSVMANFNIDPSPGMPHLVRINWALLQRVYMTIWQHTYSRERRHHIAQASYSYLSLVSKHLRYIVFSIFLSSMFSFCFLFSIFYVCCLTYIPGRYEVMGLEHFLLPFKLMWTPLLQLEAQLWQKKRKKIRKWTRNEQI